MELNEILNGFRKFEEGNESSRVKYYQATATNPATGVSNTTKYMFTPEQLREYGEERHWSSEGISREVAERLIYRWNVRGQGRYKYSLDV